MSNMNGDSSDVKMCNVNFEYRPGASVIDTEMRIFIDGKVYHLKKDEKLDIELPSGTYHAAFKSSILGTNLDFDVKKDVKVLLGWDRSGKISVKIN